MMCLVQLTYSLGPTVAHWLGMRPGTKITGPQHSGDLCQSNEDLDCFEWYGHGPFVRALHEPQFLEASRVGVHVGVIAIGGLCQRISAARAYMTKRVQQIKPGRRQLRDQRSRRLEAEVKVRRLTAS